MKRRARHARILTFALIALTALSLPAAPDGWVIPSPGVTQVGGRAYPAVRPAEFYAEVVLDELNVYLRSDSAAGVTLFYSHDEPGHWPSRNWRKTAMRQRGTLWDATLPVAVAGVPVVYFARLEGASPGMTPMRVVRPDEAGMRRPSRIFWPFLAGFESGVGPWETVNDIGQIAVAKSAFQGNGALEISIPDGKRSVTVATPLVRGWHFSRQGAVGLRFAVRCERGEGRVRLTLFSDAGTKSQKVVYRSAAKDVARGWRVLDFPMRDAAAADLGRVDRLTVEFVGSGPETFALDDLELTGNWPGKRLR